MEIDLTPEFLASQRFSKNFQNRFWKKVKKTDSCWIWNGGAINGYGHISRGSPFKGGILAHVASWNLHFGTIPERLKVLHKCDNPPCVRPEHLWLGTQKDNIHDAALKGRRSSQLGERNSHHKLTQHDVDCIRIACASRSCTQRSLAMLFGVTEACISSIILGKRWPMD